MLVKPYAIVALALSANMAMAQETSLLQAFSGRWFSFEPRMTTSEACTLFLSLEPAAQGGLKAGSQNCAAPLDQLALWGIVDGKIRLLGANGPLAALGGHQLRMSGVFGQNAQPIVLERANGDTNAQALSRAMADYRCLFAGYTDICASPEQAQIPPVVGQTPRQIVTLVALNVRSEPRSDAPINTVLKPGVIANVDTCVVTSDGPWCRLSATTDGGWIARNALRQETWPVMTYTFKQNSKNK